MNRVRLLLFVTVISAAGCAGGTEVVATSSTAPPTTVHPVPSAAPTSTAGATTTIVGPPTTTITVPPPLDRSAEASVQRMVDDVATLVGFGPRVQGTDAERAAGEWIAQSIIEIAGSVETMPVRLPNQASSRNLWVTVGEDDADHWIALGAHYDSISGSPGADDNASGTAVVLEMARRLSEVAPDGVAVTLLLFGAEEIHPGRPRSDHHFGSRQWVEARRTRGGRLPDLMVSVDMIGVGDRLLAVSYRDTDAAAAQQLVAIGESLGITIEASVRGDISDHEPFARAGVPAAMLWRPDNPNYHEPDDTTVTPEYLVDILAMVEALVASPPA